MISCLLLIVASLNLVRAFNNIALQGQHHSSFRHAQLLGMASESVQDVVVIGGGLSGCTAAFYLNKLGVDVMLAEAGSEIGGNMVTKRSADGYQWEEGPNSFTPSTVILRYVKDLGMIDELVLADPKLPRFVYWDGSLHALPGGLNDLPTFDLLTCTFSCIPLHCK